MKINIKQNEEENTGILKKEELIELLEKNYASIT